MKVVGREMERILRIPRKNKNAVYCLQISALVPEIFVFEKQVKYTNEITLDVIYSTQNYTKHINRANLLHSFHAIEEKDWCIGTVSVFQFSTVHYWSANRLLSCSPSLLRPFAFRDEIREECLLGISVHSVVSLEFSFLFFVPRCFLFCLFSLDVPFLVVLTDRPCLVPFFSRLPSDRGELPLSSARDPSVHSTKDNEYRVTMPVRCACIESRRLN